MSKSVNDFNKWLQEERFNESIRFDAGTLTFLLYINLVNLVLHVVPSTITACKYVLSADKLIT